MLTTYVGFESGGSSVSYKMGHVHCFIFFLCEASCFGFCLNHTWSEKNQVSCSSEIGLKPFCFTSPIPQQPFASLCINSLGRAHVRHRKVILFLFRLFQRRVGRVVQAPPLQLPCRPRCANGAPGSMWCSWSMWCTQPSAAVEASVCYSASNCMLVALCYLVLPLIYEPPEIKLLSV